MRRCHRYSVNLGWVLGKKDLPPLARRLPPIESLVLPVVESVSVVLLAKGHLGVGLAGQLVSVPASIPAPVSVSGIASMVRLPPSTLRAGGARVAH